MTRNEFAALCAERHIDPAIALENDAVCTALRAKNRAALIHALDTEF